MLRNLSILLTAAALALWAGPEAQAGRPDVSASPAPASDHPPAAAAPKAEPGRTPPFHGLLAASETEVRSRLGPPDVAWAKGSGAMWTYRLPDCALFVFFKAPQGQPLQVSGATSGPRVRGRNPPPVNECMAEALNRQGALAARSTP